MYNCRMQAEYIKNLYRASLVFIVILSLFFAVKLLAEFRAYGMMGSSEANTITLSGHGEVEAVPDIASVYFTIESSKATQSASSDEVNTKTKSILDFLKSSGITERDIKTEGYNSYPKYSNPEPCPLYYSPNSIMPPCRSESKIIGYTVSQNISVKIRKVDDVSKIVDGLNKIGVTNMSGPNFTIDDPDALQAKARKEAIADAKAKAEVLAKDLGVRLGRVANFSESGYPGPIFYGKARMEADSVSSASVPSEIPAGENTITSDVTITYEIR